MSYVCDRMIGQIVLAIALLGSFTMASYAQPSSGIVVYNAQHKSLTEAWAEGFTRETGIKVTIRKGGDTQMANQIVLEGPNSPADVFLTENSPAMALVDRNRLFAPLPNDVLDQVPAEYRPSNGHWVGIAARSTVLVYNKNKVAKKDLPRSLLDLADDRWKKRWAASPAGADFQAIVSALLELKGEAITLSWLQAMKANVVAYRGNSAAMKAVNAGQVDAALIYHYYYFGDQAKTGENSTNVASHYFRNRDPGAFVSLSGGGVLKSSKKPAEAIAFLKWVAGKGGQKILRTGNSFEYAVGVGEASHPKLVPLADLQAPKIDPMRLNNKKVTDLMIKAGLL